MSNFPRMYCVKQHLPYAEKIENVEDAVKKEVEPFLKSNRLPRGASLAVTAGSRGINNIALILKTICSCLTEYECKPFIIPAMGSHGGANAAGQLDILESLGITEQSMGVKIKSSMEVVQIGKTRSGYPVFVDKYAAESDGIVLINRIKPHTEFEGSFESGLQKMSVIGLGNHKGAVVAHAYALRSSYEQSLQEISSVVLDKLPIFLGVALLENSYEKTAMVKAISPPDIPAEDQQLLVEASRMMPRLPFETIDLLIVEKIGKNISGTGMDTNVIGRLMVYGAPEPTHIDIGRIAVLDLTPEAHGNAIGIGLADFTTERCVNKIDRQATYVNALTACTPEKGRIPVYYADDREVLQQALASIGVLDVAKARIVQIKNTLEMEYLKISEAIYSDIKNNPQFEVLTGPEPIKFSEEGELSLIEYE